ncbi:Hypothetical predicted protein [Paramuricea clavata]|uniref:DDE Tnp4 domain-containing protein n=1 Tax=Paramuricea clavata TaxID=317549 RepID=A0A7D9I0K4_PARCT|nr:Hypothetical predicted protein [Paramuricea clavata]
MSDLTSGQLKQFLDNIKLTLIGIMEGNVKSEKHDWFVSRKDRKDMTFNCGMGRFMTWQHEYISSYLKLWRECTWPLTMLVLKRRPRSLQGKHRKRPRGRAEESSTTPLLGQSPGAVAAKMKRRFTHTSVQPNLPQAKIAKVTAEPPVPSAKSMLNLMSSDLSDDALLSSVIEMECVLQTSLEVGVRSFIRRFSNGSTKRSRRSCKYMTNDECRSDFRVDLADLPILAEALRIPEKFVCLNRTLATGMEDLCVAHRRFAYPCRFSDMIPRSGRSVSELSLITSERIMYNGHKRIHAIKFQSVVAPNGLIANLYGPIEGKRHDAAMLRTSGLLDQLDQHYQSHGHTPLSSKIDAGTYTGTKGENIECPDNLSMQDEPETIGPSGIIGWHSITSLATALFELRNVSVLTTQVEENSIGLLNELPEKTRLANVDYPPRYKQDCAQTGAVHAQEVSVKNADSYTWDCQFKKIKHGVCYKTIDQVVISPV